MLYPALAFGARAAVEAGSAGAGGLLADELLVLWRAKLRAYPASSWVVDLAFALHGLGRGADLVDTAGSVTTGTRWLEAVVAFAGGEHLAAAERFDRIGSRPDASCARLRGAQALLGAGRAAGVHAELDRAVAFYRDVDATAYLADATRLAEALLSELRPT
jgi:hypothetical protein